jgi:hypothetical protein
MNHDTSQPRINLVLSAESAGDSTAPRSLLSSLHLSATILVDRSAETAHQALAHACLERLAGLARPTRHPPAPGLCHCRQNWVYLEFVPLLADWFDAAERATWAVQVIRALHGLADTVRATSLVTFAEEPWLVSLLPSGLRNGPVIGAGNPGGAPQPELDPLLEILRERLRARGPVVGELLANPTTRPVLDPGLVAQMELGLEPLSWALVRLACGSGGSRIRIEPGNRLGSAAAAAAEALVEAGFLRARREPSPQLAFERANGLRRSPFRSDSMLPAVGF